MARCCLWPGPAWTYRTMVTADFLVAGLQMWFLSEMRERIRPTSTSRVLTPKYGTCVPWSQVSPGSKFRGNKSVKGVPVGTKVMASTQRSDQYMNKLIKLEFQQQQGLHQFVDPGSEAAPVVGAFVTFNHEMSYAGLWKITR